MLASLFYRNPRLTALVVGFVLVAGLAAFESLPRQEDPAVSRRVATITTFLPGGSAARVESLVTERIKRRLQALHEIGNLHSLTQRGVSVITVELDEAYSGSEVDVVWSRLRDRLADVQGELPAEASAPRFEDHTTTAATLISALVWTQDEAPQLDLLTRLAQELEQQLRNLPGTRKTKLFGAAVEEIRVTIDPLILASVNLTASEVSRAIAAADTRVPSGRLRQQAHDFLIEVEGELDSVARIRDIPLRREPGGSLLRVGDIARVEKTVQDPPSSLALIAGRPGVAVSVTLQPDRRVDHWAEQARALVDEFRRTLPAGISLEILFDQSGYTGERLGSLAGNLVLGALLVVAVLFVLMGARSALIVAAALPLTVAAVLAELQLLGVPLHQTSVTGLIVALGLLIDNAIVAVDAYGERVRGGAAPAEAVARSVRQLCVPLLASTVTTVLAFLPVVLMPGDAGEFMGPVSIGVALAVASSFLLSMTVIPALAGFLTPSRDAGVRAGWWQQGFSSPRLLALHRRTLDALLRRPLWAVGVSVALPLLGFALSTTLEEQFFPPNDRDQFQIQLVLPSQSSVFETRANALRARQIVHAHAEVVESHWFIGTAAPRVFYNMFTQRDGVSSYAGAFVTSVSTEATERLLPRLQLELNAAFPNARALALPFEQGPAFEAPIEVRIVGPEIEELRRLGDELRSVLAGVEGVTYTAATLSGSEPTLRVRADADAARAAELDLADIAHQLEARLEGSLGGSVFEANQELPVRVRVGDELRGDLARIASGSLLTGSRDASDADGRLPGVPLSALSEIELVPEVAGVPRRNGERCNTVQGFLAPYALPARSLTAFRERLARSGVSLPAGYRIEWGGETEQRGDAVGHLVLFALPLLVVMGGTIVLSLNSFRLAGVVGLVAFLSVGLALFGVWLFGYPFGFLAILGTLGLVGLAINGAIVVLSALRADAGAAGGDPTATREVVLRETRHIVATTLTTIGGFLPLILWGGRSWPPLVTAIAGGVAGAALLSLYLVPALHLWLAGHHQRRPARVFAWKQRPGFFVGPNGDRSFACR